MDWQDLNGATAIWIASCNGHHDIVSLLLHGDETKEHQNDSNDRQITTVIAAYPHLANNDGCTPLWIAASRGNSKCIEQLIKQGADLNEFMKTNGATPLHVACQNNRKLVVDLLLAANCDINRAPSWDRVTPLMVAIDNGHIEIVRKLLKKPNIGMFAGDADLQFINVNICANQYV